MPLFTHPHAPAPVRPSNEEFDRHVREAMRDSANAISVAWLPPSVDGHGSRRVSSWRSWRVWGGEGGERGLNTLRGARQLV